MVRALVKKCVDCKCELPRLNKHHFRCHRCWQIYMADYDKHKLILPNKK